MFFDISKFLTGKRKKKQGWLFSNGYKPRHLLVRVPGVPARAGDGQRTQRFLTAFW